MLTIQCSRCNGAGHIVVKDPVSVLRFVRWTIAAIPSDASKTLRALATEARCDIAIDGHLCGRDQAWTRPMMEIRRNRMAALGMSTTIEDQMLATWPDAPLAARA